MDISVSYVKTDKIRVKLFLASIIYLHIYYLGSQ
jgi:hypothetical protein